MRTTLEIDDDVLDEARVLASRKGQGLGRTLSELARRGLVPEESSRMEVRDGIPVWVHGPGAIPVTNALVRSLLDTDET